VLRAPSPSIVVQVRAVPGGQVAVGDVLVVLESMKMESTLVATVAGTVREVLVEANHQVDAGDALLRVEPAAGGPAAAPPARRVGFARLTAAPAATAALEIAIRRLLGFAPGPEPPADAAPEAESEIALAGLFAACCSLGSRRRAGDAAAPTRGISAQEWLFTFLRAPGRSRDVLPGSFLDELASTLGTYGATALEPGERLDEALYRLCCAQQALAEIEPLVVGILRRWLDDAPAAGQDLLALLERLSEACETSFPAVSDSAQAVAHELYVRPALAGRSRPPVTHDPIDAATAERLELWRLREFAVRHVMSSGDLHLFEGVAHSNPEDRRLFVIGGVRDVAALQTGDDEPAVVPELEHALVESLAMIRMHQAAVPPAQRALFNRVMLYVESPWEVTGATLHHLAHRLARPARNLGIEKVLARVRVPGPDGVPVDRLLHMTAPATTGVALGETAPSPHPVRPLSRRQQRILKLRRRGLRDPYEIADLLVARDAQHSDFPPGEFRELDLDDAGELAGVHRPYGENTAGIVAGIVENVTAKHPDGIRRVVLLSDPGRGLGALAEPECRRIIAAIDLAERLAIPVEWFTVSSGARISMSSGTENMDWVARALRRIVGFTQSGGEINVVVSGVNVGAQPYFNAEATMLMHTRGILVMTPSSSMLLTGKEALDFAGGVSAEDNLGIGGYDRVMGPNGQAQYWAPTLEAACETLFRHYDHTYVVSGERFPRDRETADPAERDVRAAPHPRLDASDFGTVGDIFSDALNPERKKPFAMRAVMRAVVDADSDPLERWSAMAGAEGAIVWDAHLGGHPICLIGIESHPLPRAGIIPADGPDAWSAATLFPRSSKKVARTLNAASANRPAVILANLAGFDGSPESLREQQLEYGAEIGRAITNFSGPLILCVVSRYHGGAFVVFSKTLNDELQVLAVEGARASVIGGPAAAAVVFARDVEARVLADERVAAIEQAWKVAGEHGRLRLDAEREDLLQRVRGEVRGEVAREFDAIHTIERALRVGSVDRVIAAEDLRPELIDAVERGIQRTREGDARAAAIDR
jgi:acetyl-CoA carboxylase carboxyltransferase component